MPTSRPACWGVFAAIVSLLVGIVTFALRLPGVRADDTADDAEKQEAQARKERYTNWMRTYAEGTRIRLPAKKDGDEEQMGELVPNPVFRYSDEERLIPDATLWVWTHDSRPVAFQKVEGNNYGGGRQWTICFASLSEGLIDVDWPTGRKYSARKPGVAFNPIPGAGAPADNPRGRTAQLKSLKEQFTGRLNVNEDGTRGAQTRTMAKPIFEYSHPKTKLPLGAIFGMTSTGTNPDLLLLIEARQDGEGNLRWEYALARMTSASLRVRLEEGEVWAENAVPSGAYDNWTFYFMPRDFQ
ncbi:MAG: hypothetical protein ACM3U2_03615 [Deltaproteobacteria bacterium]